MSARAGRCRRPRRTSAGCRSSRDSRLSCDDRSAHHRPHNRHVATFAGSRNLAFVIRSSKIQGNGAFATRRIRKGDRIIEYLGECIDADESDIRYPDGEMGRHHTFLFSIGDGSRVLDAGPLEWPAKYVNHSCDPNCEALEEEDGRVFVHALKTIEKNQELLYDYAYERTPEHNEEDEVLYKCLCGSPKCRGSILAPPKPKKVKQAKVKQAKVKQAKEKQGKKKQDKKKQDKKSRKEKKARKALEAAATPAGTAVTTTGATDAARVTTRATKRVTTLATQSGTQSGTQPVTKRVTTLATKSGTQPVTKRVTRLATKPASKRATKTLPKGASKRATDAATRSKAAR
ncbi:MAG: SET domain-containing protein-lysine N-methyltransferase [Gemmatimonadaceae bacterium]|nr:SET domain-containing protein-lysine N-methyltransferase [Gemmatimonadaceae bacterium]